MSPEFFSVVSAGIASFFAGLIAYWCGRSHRIIEAILEDGSLTSRDGKDRRLKQSRLRLQIVLSSYLLLPFVTLLANGMPQLSSLNTLQTSILLLIGPLGATVLWFLSGPSVNAVLANPEKYRSRFS